MGWVQPGHISSPGHAKPYFGGGGGGGGEVIIIQKIISDIPSSSFSPNHKKIHRYLCAIVREILQVLWTNFDETWHEQQENYGFDRLPDVTVTGILYHLAIKVTDFASSGCHSVRILITTIQYLSLCLCIFLSGNSYTYGQF